MPRDDLVLLTAALLLYRPLNALARAGTPGSPPASRACAGKWAAVRGALVAVTGVAWIALPPGSGMGAVRFPVYVALLAVTWRTATRDYDVTRPVAPQRRARLYLLVSGTLGLMAPPVLLEWQRAALGWLGGWEHHAHMPVRVVRMYVASELAVVAGAVAYAAAGVPFHPTGAGAFMLLVCVVLSHYLRPGLDKLVLGRRPWDWCVANRTHYLAAAAYHWGWANFLPRRTAMAVVARLAPLDRAMNAFTLAGELLCLLGLLHPWALALALGTLVVLHAGIFAASGILFWESAVTCLAFAAASLSFPAPVAADAFGPAALAVAAAVVALPVLAGVPWRPNRLAWWDTPLAARVRWEVEGSSGVRYGLYNDYMCPREREYGRTPGLFLVPEPVVHGHLGIVWDRELRDQLVSSRGELGALDEIRRRWGVTYFDPVQAAEHERFLADMLGAAGRGVPKRVLPRALGWLKAPGGQLFYWGRTPRYTGQEPVRRVHIYYTEMYFDWEQQRSRLLRDQLLRTVNL